MFKYVLLFAFIAYVSAGAVGKSDDAAAEITVLSSDVRPDGFEAALETSNSIRQVSSGDAAGNIKGEYEWVSPEGQTVKVSYIADANGYQPQSDLLPTSPPIPDAIVKELEYLAAHPSKESKN
ncbi:larval cuticle protein 2-like [Anastrepha obliqua]|uniref:larval cuticle protein 2-like n=1 Tax=Anastrepha obliqua TaxID=95512 RepID=UPI0024098222|nr:larval cuticle protein 2-like [Anastrepha obliqua]